MDSTSWILRAAIAILALADGVLHLMLDFVLFRGNLWGPLQFGPPPEAPGGASGPPPGPQPPQLPLQLNQLFLLNFVGFIVLVLLFWFGHRWLGRWHRLVDVALILYTATVFVGWVAFGMPNPMGLGYISKAIEIVLVIALLAHLWMGLRPRGVAAT